MKAIASSLWTYFLPAKWRIITVYIIVVLEAIVVGATALVTSVLISHIEKGNTIILLAVGYLLVRYALLIAVVHVSNMTRSVIKSTVHTAVVKSEWTKETVSGEVLAKVGMSGSIPSAIIDDIPDVITMVVTLGVLVTSMLTLGLLPVVVLSTVIILGAIITAVKSRYVGNLHKLLYTVESARLPMIESRDVVVLDTWVSDRLALLVKFWWADTNQGLVQAPVVLLGLATTLVCINLTVESFVLVLGIYGTVYYQIDKFARIQESMAHLIITLSKLKTN
jgi:hypothetical protein